MKSESNTETPFQRLPQQLVGPQRLLHEHKKPRLHTIDALLIKS